MDELLADLNLHEEGSRPRCDVSIVLAAYNEESCIQEELDKIRTAMEASSFSYEILVIDATTEETRLIPCGVEGVNKWRGIACCGNKLFCPPCNANTVIPCNSSSVVICHAFPR